jgi:hypothetical protein
MEYNVTVLLLQCYQLPTDSGLRVATLSRKPLTAGWRHSAISSIDANVTYLAGVGLSLHYAITN